MWAKDAEDLRPKEKLYELRPKSGDLLETGAPGRLFMSALRILVRILPT